MGSGLLRGASPQPVATVHYRGRNPAGLKSSDSPFLALQIVPPFIFSLSGPCLQFTQKMPEIIEFIISAVNYSLYTRRNGS